MTKAERVVAAYVAGDPVGDILATHGVSSHYVYWAIERAGVPSRAAAAADKAAAGRVVISSVMGELASEQAHRVACEIACKRLLRRQLETGAYWNMTPAQATDLLQGMTA